MNLGKAKCPNCNQTMTVTRIVCDRCDVRIEGAFELPDLARLSPEDQLFVRAFLKHDGSIKQMERLFKVSYPTVKNRLASISAQLEPVGELEPSEHRSSKSSEVIDLLAQDQITVEEAFRRLG